MANAHPCSLLLPRSALWVEKSSRIKSHKFPPLIDLQRVRRCVMQGTNPLSLDSPVSKPHPKELRTTPPPPPLSCLFRPSNHQSYPGSFSDSQTTGQPPHVPMIQVFTFPAARKPATGVAVRGVASDRQRCQEKRHGTDMKKAPLRHTCCGCYDRPWRTGDRNKARRADEGASVCMYVPAHRPGLLLRLHDVVSHAGVRRTPQEGDTHTAFLSAQGARAWLCKAFKY